MSDPATEQWRQAIGESTGALLRRALDANSELAMEHAKCVLTIARLRAENERLAAQVARRPGAYWLTRKGLDAITQEATP